MAGTIKLIVGLGNPGPEYAKTRHNVGAWFTQQLADQLQESLRLESKFRSLVAKINLAGESCWLAQPTTYMNESGQAVKAVAQFYKIAPEEILIAHDELDFPAGTIRIKEAGGHGGHNGLRDIIQHLGTPDFYRLRIGIGHPGDKNKVSAYVLNEPSQSDKQRILTSIEDGLRAVEDIVTGDFQKAMRYLHQE